MEMQATGSILYLPVLPSYPFLVTGVPWPMQLELQQELVGGYVQPFTVVPGGIVGWCNEDGQAMNLLPNILATLTCERALLGPVFFTGGFGWHGQDDWAPLPADLCCALVEQGGTSVTINDVLESIRGKAS